MKTAVVHDWLTGMRGGEKVLSAILELYPEADLFTLIHNSGSVSENIENRKIVTSFIDHLPFKSKHYRHYLPLFPTAIELFNFKDYDLIISTSHCVAKGVRPPPDTLHISYIHSPMRYVWDMYEDYFGSDKLNILTRMIIPPIANYLRTWDAISSNRVDHFIANSRHVARRIFKYYRRHASVIYPPVEISPISTATQSEDYYLVVSALVPYKRIDLAVSAFNKLDKQLLIIGDGPERSKLQKQANNNIKFVDWLPPDQLNSYYAGCKALIFPGEEDFGIVPVEVQGFGKPVIAFSRGGALETVIGLDDKNEGQCTGIFFNRQTDQDLMGAIQQCEKKQWNNNFIHEHAHKFSKENFKKQMVIFIQEKIADFRAEKRS
jgi:glycosyltransferase involved in cell wall biosynthesis